ncbi:hypothetical protein ACWD5R_43690 [Streptomyces sp. NPDC002514]
MSAAEATPVEDAEDVPQGPRLSLVKDEWRLARIAALGADLRPYLPTRSQLRAPLRGVGAGTRVLAGRGWAWLSEDGWIWDGLTKAGAIAGGAYFGLPAVWDVVEGTAGPYAPFVPTAALVCGCVIARRFAPAGAKTALEKANRPEAAVDIEDQDDDEPEYLDEDAAELIDIEDVAALIRKVASRHDHQGAHLEDLLTEDLFVGWEKGELKTALAGDYGLPVESFKLIFPTAEGKRQRVREGVRLRHLPPAPAEGAGEGPARGLALVPPQPAAGATASTPPGAPAGLAAEPSPTEPAAPSQGPG